MHSYDEWKDKLNIEDDDIVFLPNQSTRPNKSNLKNNNKQREQPGIDVSYQNDRIVVFPRRTNAYDFLENIETQRNMLTTEWGRNAARALFSFGANFAYGMLHEHSFDFSKQVQYEVEKYHHEIMMTRNINNSDEYYTIGVHSRHNDTKFTGCDISREKLCIHKLLQTDQRKKKTHCRVVIMSDRKCTLDNLSKWLAEPKQSCHVDVASWHVEGQGYYEEHGEYAGGGYFKDLGLASSIVRDAVVGTILDERKFGSMWRSSSALLRELVEYHRIMEIYADGNTSRGDKGFGGRTDASITRRVQDSHVDTCLMDRPENVQRSPS